MNVVTAANPLAISDGQSSYFPEVAFWPSLEGKVGLSGGDDGGGLPDWVEDGGGGFGDSSLMDGGSLLSDLSSDWLVDPLMNLFTSDEQPGYESSPFSSPYTSPQALSTLSPDSSLPSSPLSASCYYSDDLEASTVMASILEDQPSSFHFSSPSCPPNSQYFTPDTSLSQPLETNAYCPEVPPTLPENQPSSRKRKASPSSVRPQAKRNGSQVSKKERKREQNKTAALRYRQRRKEAKFTIEDRQKALEDQNRQLSSKVESVTREIQYLQKLWREVCQAKEKQRS